MARVYLSSKHWLLILFLLVIFLYSLFQARFIILGPHIEIDSPDNGALVDSGVVTLSGKALNIAWISLNDRQIFIDENGAWSEKLIAPPGYSIMTVKARDRFGRETQKSVELVYKE